MRETLDTYCIRTGNQTLLDQWDSQQNDPYTPQTVTYGSKKKMWWRCKEGHAWKASIYTRTGSGTGSPYCAGRKVLPGFNDLASTEPQIALQWHPGLNGSLTPEMVTSGTRRKVWWQCPEGHVWKAAIYSRTGQKKCGCPVCAGHIGRERLNRYQNILIEGKETIQI